MADDDDDEVSTGTFFGPKGATGPRRSTFTPPAPESQIRPLTTSGFDDDDLATALAADLARINTGLIDVVPPSLVHPQLPVEPEDYYPSAPSPVTVDPTVQAPPQTPWSSLPAPGASQIVELPEGPAAPPVRRSLPDEQLLSWVDNAGRAPGGTLKVIEELQNQLRLREQEAAEFRNWEGASSDTPTPAESDDQTGPPSWDRVPDSPFARSVLGQNPVSVPVHIPTTADVPVTASTSAEPEPDEPISARALPTWDIAPPSENWAPAPEYTDADADEAVLEESRDNEPALQESTVEERGEQAVNLGSSWPFTLGAENVLPGPPPLISPTTPPRLWVQETPIIRDDDAPVTAEIVEDPGPPALIEPSSQNGSLFNFPTPSGPPADGPPFDPAFPLASGPIAVPQDYDFSVPPVAPVPAAASADSFENLLGGGSERPAPHAEPGPQPATEHPSGPEAIFIEPIPVSADGSPSLDTGSVRVVDQTYDEELPDDVDESDRVTPGILGAVSVDTSGIAMLPASIAPPSGPISTVRIPEDEVVLNPAEPIRQRVLSLEESGLEPTPMEQRIGQSARLFWLWFASNSSILSLGLGATVFAVGMSLRQSVVAVLAGVALSFIPLGLTTLAGKRSGQPTMVVSRATFGVLGNILPASLALITRLFWGAVLLWLLASSVAIILVGAGLNGPFGDRQLLLVSLAVAFLLALLVAFAGYPLIARIQAILSAVSALLIIGLIALTWQYVNFDVALSTPDGSWVLTITGAVLVFSFVGLIWAHSGADLARYQQPGSNGGASMLWATFGTTLPTFVLIAYGALLAASDEGIASGFLLSPLDTLSLMLPQWYPIPLIAATALSLLCGIVISLYSGGFALQAIGLRVRRQWSIVIVGVLLGILALVLTFGVTGGITEVFRDIATTLAVPTAAWAGIFAAETMIRNRRFDSQSLLSRGGVYPDVRWVNTIALVVISIIGFGLTSATVNWLSWQGYGFTLLGMPLHGDLAGSDLGVLVALILGLAVPLAGGVRAIRRQESVRI